jgi:NitT/TauT family transport system substrate-binding protein
MTFSRRYFIAGLGAMSCARREPSTVTVVARPYLEMASLFLADEGGYFAEEGLRIQVRGAESSRISVPMLAAGEADVAGLGPNSSLFNAILRGARLRIVAGRHTYSSACTETRRFYGSQKSFPHGFTDLRQMKGKRVAFVGIAASLGKFIGATALRQSGLTPADVKLSDLDDKKISTALLLSGDLDVVLPAAEFELGATTFRDRVVEGPPIASIIPDFMDSFFVFGKRLLDGPSSTGVRFLRAYFRAARDYKAGKSPAKFFAELARNGMDAQKLQSRCRDGFLTDGRVQIPDLQRFADWCVQEQFIESALDARSLVDLRFLSEARLA